MKKLKDIHESLKTNQQNEEQVTVNQRHLIDKILARYSTEFTIFRELLQNSNDAGATQVTINLQTSNSNFITTIEYKNNGRPFLKEDWARLRKIAEGNPDEQKIGFFGVGFYSLFSICEEPFISSGVECMAFFWKGDQLFTKRGSLPERDELTTFLLELREPMDLMDIQSFGKFIATSLAFTKCLHEVTVNFNEICVLSFKKKVSNPKLVEFKKSSFNLSSPNKIFYLNEVELKKIQLDVSINLEYKNIDSVPIQSTLFMRTASAAFKVNTSRAMTHDMERTTKKKPPATTETHIMWSSHDEYESSTGCKGKNPVFDDLVPNKEEQGKVFIGFPTHQTTGCAIHFMSHLIPTVERESIDFVDKTLNLWNQELLSTTGLLARILYVDEFASIKDMFENVPKPIDPEIYSWLLKRSLHAMLSFTFKPTTPNNLVGRIVSKYFFISAPNEIIEIMSTRGVLAANNVRVFSAEPMGGYERKFIKNTATVPDEILIKCSVLINNLMSDNTIQQINFKDVLSELNSNFTVDEVVKLLKWFIMYRDNCTLNSNELETFLKNLVLPVTGDSANKNLKLTLSNIKYWINPKVITPGLSVPEDSFPLEISKHFSKTELEHYFGNIKELSLSEWTIFISKNEDLVLSPHFSEKVLSTISRSFMSVSNQQKHSIVSTLKDLSCIPTKQGMKKPCDAYFKNVNLFDDIPVVLFPSQIIKKDEASETSTKSVTSFFGGLLSNAVEKISSSIRQSPVSEVFLKSLGVREHVELQVVFDRLDSLNWDHYQLIKYLASVSNKLSEKEYSQLKATPLFPKQTLDSSTDNFRYKAMDLYAPTEEIKELGLPILSWKGRWHKNTEEAKLLSLMGLKQQIPLFELLLLTSKSADRVQQTKFLAYFVENFSIYEESYSHVKNTPELSPFLPSTNVKGENILSKPNDCFSDPGCSLMGFNVLRPDLVVNAEKFGVRKYPNSVELVRYLERSPPKSEEAAAVFEFLSYQKFSNYDWKTLRGLKFIPLNRKGAMVYEAPYKVYFVGLESSQFQNYFDFVDFGQVGNSFLRNCGVKDEPTPTELAQLLVRSPLQFFEDSGLDSYLSLLRQIAAHYHVLRSNTALKKEMMQSSFLVGLINDVSEEEEINDETREGKTSEKVRNPQLSYKLAKAGDIFLIDDTILQQIFTPLGCPMEALLEV
ncbi:hypothetical protein HK099_005915 [Clydaea vesicula]|uniref:Sacsin/Nov domain-containing protein n=1 Tax=Clydaea vesicula TaxID=447962 RepID=A0AAD5TYR0_9FUNG|nr:hypothetical protein HK099_005915 [Clydaea vesicula]